MGAVGAVCWVPPGIKTSWKVPDLLDTFYAPWEAQQFTFLQQLRCNWREMETGQVLHLACAEAFCRFFSLSCLKSLCKHWCIMVYRWKFWVQAEHCRWCFMKHEMQMIVRTHGFLSLSHSFAHSRSVKIYRSALHAAFQGSCWDFWHTWWRMFLPLVCKSSAKADVPSCSEFQITNSDEHWFESLNRQHWPIPGRLKSIFKKIAVALCGTMWHYRKWLRLSENTKVTHFEK